MKHSENKEDRFQFKSIVEKQPFGDPAVQSFFTRWCEINDSIEPEFVDREEWNSLSSQGILKKKPDGKSTLFIPYDLQLWEMIDIVKAIDTDTFATNPEKGVKSAEEMHALGETMKSAGVYIAKRISRIERGRSIAESLALQLYQYGQLLTQGKTEETPQLDDIASRDLTPEETDSVDRFLAGDYLYKSRIQKIKKELENKGTIDQTKIDELFERWRLKTLNQFFRVTEKAMELDAKSKSGELLPKRKEKLKPWQSDDPIHKVFLGETEEAVARQIRTPYREMGSAIFRRGMELLQRNMPFDTLPDQVKDTWFHWRNGETTLREALRIDGLREELEQVRSEGDVAQIAEYEKYIARRIRVAVSSYKRISFANNPSKMIVSQLINCVGASTLGGALMKEAGLNYLVGDVPNHSILLLVTSNGQVEWYDMLNHYGSGGNLTNEMIDGKRKDGKPLKVSDIVAFSQNPDPEGLMFDIKDSQMYRRNVPNIKEGQRPYLRVIRPEYGQQAQILNNTGNALDILGLNKEAIKAYQQAIEIDPRFTFPHINLGDTLYELGHPEEAIKAYQQAIEIDPKYADPYNGLGDALAKLGRPEEAIEAYQQAIEIDPKFAYPYYGLGIALDGLGRPEEAIEAYKKFIDLADKKTDDYWITRAKERINELEEGSA